VRQSGGHLHLRIDDLDSDRIRVAYIQDVFDTLEWLEIDYDTGPRSVEDFVQNWSQKRRLAIYYQVLEKLREQGDIYVCECSRSTLGAFAESGVYTGLCRNKNLSFDAPLTAWRFYSPSSTESCFFDNEQGEMCVNVAELSGDVVVRRKDGIPAYHIASLVDDELDETTLIVRGMDLLPSTAIQIALAQTLSWKHFPSATFVHHQLLMGANQHKLSKSHGSSSLKEMREQGVKPSEVYRLVATSVGITTRVQTLTELLDAFVTLKQR
jgi:glutamyl/glutaminyl-tRNA synthetase